MTLQTNELMVSNYRWAPTYIDPCAENSTGPNVSYAAGGATIIRAVAGTPVTLAVQAEPAVFPAGSPSYSVFITVERLSPPGSN
jgi:hypothetical protein